MTPPPVVNLADAQPKAPGFADLVASAYLSGSELVIPTTEGAKDLPKTGGLPHEAPRWVGFDSVPVGNGQTLEQHRFLFYRVYSPKNPGEAPVKQLNELFVTLAINPDGSPALASQPLFQPVPYRDVTGSVFPESDEQLPPAATEALNRWALAWARGDSQQLKDLAGDGTEGVTYIGLGGGCTATSITPDAVFTAGAEQWLVRARVAVQCANQFTTEMDLDITLVGAPPNPTRVVGWGPAGAGTQGPDDVRVKP